MKKKISHPNRLNLLAVSLVWLSVWCVNLKAAPATSLFEDHFTGGIPGWTAVQPAGGIYFDGPMIWEFDKTTDSFSEQSNIFTDAAVFSGSRIACMLINATAAPTNFTYTARLTAGDDDAFGLIWGYEDEDSFYRVSFARQVRAVGGWPNQGFIVDRMNNGQYTDLVPPSNAFVNTANRPFDVTLVVNNGRLTLSVVDDPLGVATPIALATDVPLPTVPNGGKVGIFSWGQSGGTPRAFRIQNPVLSPTPLTGDPAATVLTNWSFLITPRGSDGTVPVVATTPLWSQGVSINGDRGTMIENSDWLADNTTSAFTNFAAPTAIAGDVNWSNYVYTARIISSDNDGFGILLRYRNETNFYRIAFRNQANGSGVRTGISIQKNVDLVFDQIFASTAFIPPVGVPIDVNAFIRDNRLQIVIVANPLSAAAQSSFFGPFDITGGTVDTGKIGVFSWAQYNEASQRAGTEVDFVKVQSVAGEGLIVSSAFGTPEPPLGLNDFPVSTVLTAAVESVVMNQPGVRQISTGWSGVGAVPASGATNSVTFTLSTFSSIIWKWRTEYLLTTTTTSGGSIVANLGPWVSEGSNVTVVATADPGFIFTGWSGANISTSSNLNFAMTRPVSLTANFSVDSDNDGLPDSWEMQYFKNLDQDASGQLPDNDGVNHGDEFRRGTDPTFAETLVVSDGLGSKWINTQRDPVLSGQLGVVEFGPGYRGAFDDSNDNRAGSDFTFIPSTNAGNFASWQGSRVLVQSNLWTADWATNFSASMELSVGDNDGNSLYFRYKDEKNWYRATLSGEDPLGNTARPALGLSIQRRLNGKYDTLVTTPISGPAFAAYTDPTDGSGTPAGFKKVRITVNATNENFEVRVIGWNALASPPDFDPNFELIETFSDTNHLSGRIGFGFWGMGAFGNNQNQINGIPIPTGGFVDNIVVKSPVGGPIVFSEDWETSPLTNEFPAGWANAYDAGDFLFGDWRMSAHGTIMQESNIGFSSTGTPSVPRADVDGTVFLAPNQGVTNYLLQVGLHPYDDDGVGVVYDFKDTNNYARVMFVAEASADGRIPQGLSISRKSGGVWSDIAAGDQAFVFTPGRPFEVQLANNNGAFHLMVRDLDNPASTFNWSWTDTASKVANRFGLTTWAATDAHFLYARALSLPTSLATVPLKITQVSLSDGNIMLDVSKPSGSLYDVLKSGNVEGPYNPTATNQSGAQYSEPAPSTTTFYRLQLVP